VPPKFFQMISRDAIFYGFFWRETELPGLLSFVFWTFIEHKVAFYYISLRHPPRLPAAELFLLPEIFIMRY